MENEPQETFDSNEIPEYVSNNTDNDTDNDTDNGVEDQARSLGWKPKDEFRGDPSNWADAEQYVEFHSKNNGMLRSANEKVSKELAEVKRQLQTLDSSHRKIFELQIKKMREEYDSQISFLKAQKREALRSGEHEMAADLDDQIDNLKSRGPELPDIPQNRPQLDRYGLPPNWRSDPTLSEWADRNTWFAKDEDMTAWAGNIGQILRDQYPQMPIDELLNTVSERARKAFPHKFTSRRAGPESATTGAAQASNAKSYGSLPRDAKQACDDAVKEGGITQKEWVDLYYGYEEQRRGRR